MSIEYFGINFDRSDIASGLLISGEIPFRSLEEAGIGRAALEDCTGNQPSAKVKGPSGDNSYLLHFGILEVDEDDPTKDLTINGFKYNKPDKRNTDYREVGFRVILNLGVTAYGVLQDGHDEENHALYILGLDIGTYNPIGGLTIYNGGDLGQQGLKFYSTDGMIGNLDDPVIAGGRGKLGALPEQSPL